MTLSRTLEISFSRTDFYESPTSRENIQVEFDFVQTTPATVFLHYSAMYEHGE